jgi:hypothetical protein
MNALVSFVKSMLDLGFVPDYIVNQVKLVVGGERGIDLHDNCIMLLDAGIKDIQTLDSEDGPMDQLEDAILSGVFGPGGDQGREKACAVFGDLARYINFYER